MQLQINHLVINALAGLLLNGSLNKLIVFREVK